MARSGAEAIVEALCAERHYLEFIGSDSHGCKPCKDWVFAMLASNNFEVRRESWEKAHAEFCPRHVGEHDYCSTHLRPGDRWWFEFRESLTPPGIPGRMAPQPESDQEQM